MTRGHYGSCLLRRPRWQHKLVAIVVWTMLAFVLSEGLLRFLGYPHSSLYRADLTLGTRILPNHRGWQTLEGRKFVRTNSAGWRDVEHSLEKTAGTYRIAVLGDSYSEARQVELTETYWSILAHELNRMQKLKPKHVEILNFGVSGYGTTQELIALEHEAFKYSPDLVLLQFLPGNDVRNNSREIELETGRPFFVIEDDELLLDNSFRDSPAMAMGGRRVPRNRAEWILQWKHFLVSNVAICSLIYELRHASTLAGTPVEPGIEELVFFPPTDDVWRDAWEITDRVLQKMHTACESRDVPLVVFTANNAMQVHPQQAVIKNAARPHGATDVLFPDEHLQQLAYETGFLFISLTLPMREIAQRDNICFHGFPNTAPCTGHWNAMGHATAGKLLAERIAQAFESGELPTP